MKVTSMVASKMLRGVSAIALLVMLGACSSLERLAQIGEPPPLSHPENPTTRPGYKPVQMPMPALQPASYNPNSLWRNGSRAFFKDQRANQIGDILTVKVNFSDKANIANETMRARVNKEDFGVDNFLGKQKLPLLNSALPTRIFTADSSSISNGSGAVQRQEALTTNVAGVVTQVLPNGNLVIEGRQEVRVNFEVRELSLPASCARKTSRATTRSTPRRLRRPASPTAGAASSPTFSNRATASRCSTSCCRSDPYVASVVALMNEMSDSRVRAR